MVDTLSKLEWQGPRLLARQDFSFRAGTNTARKTMPTAWAGGAAWFSTSPSNHLARQEFAFRVGANIRARKKCQPPGREGLLGFPPALQTILLVKILLFELAHTSTLHIVPTAWAGGAAWFPPAPQTILLVKILLFEPAQTNARNIMLTAWAGGAAWFSTSPSQFRGDAQAAQVHR